MIPASWRRVSTERLRRFLTVGLVATMGFTVGISSASAQNARQTDVAVAYVTAGYLGYDYSVHGWNAQFSAQRTRRWTLVGEFGYERENPNHRGWAGLSGGRFGWPATRASPFWQILVGGLHETGAGYEKETMNSLVVQPGGGMTVMVTRRFGMRIQADLRFGLSREVSGQSRVLAGGVMRFGN
jgi:hypothetical protein